MKVDTEFIKDGFGLPKVTESYARSVTEIGLWKSEEIVFTKYFDKDGRILDIGCGAGRTTVGMYKLGYRHIEGLDLSPDLIRSAKQIAHSLGLDISYREGNALCLPDPGNTFDGALFSFYGFMQIPGKENRIRAMTEIARVIKPGTYYIFTTHPDRESAGAFKAFWDEEKVKWAEGKQDPRLLEFGDRMITEEFGEYRSFLHFPTETEVLETIAASGLEHVEHFLRSAVCEESEKVKKFSSDCVFWVARKPS